MLGDTPIASGSHGGSVVAGRRPCRDSITMTSHTRMTTPFTRESTTDDVLDGVALHGRRAIVTGATSGVAAETARALAAAGAEVTLAVHDLAAGERAAAEDLRVAAFGGTKGLDRRSETGGEQENEGSCHRRLHFFPRFAAPAAEGVRRCR